MNKGIFYRMKEYLKIHKLKKRWQKIAFTLSAIVVFCTVYVLILPAITLEKQTVCGMDHWHTDACYIEGVSREELLDVSDGPAVFIFAEEVISEEPADPVSADPITEEVVSEENIEDEDSNDYGISLASEEPEDLDSMVSAMEVEDEVSQSITFNAVRLQNGMPQYLKTYLQSHGGNYFLTLLDTNNEELPKDADGNYIVTEGTAYKLTLTINAPDGIAPGTYQYQLPTNLSVLGGTGIFEIEGVNVGTWQVSDTGLITFNLNEEMNSRTEVTISASMGISFSHSEVPIEFDGNITVTVKLPPQENTTTGLSKWGRKGGNENNPFVHDPTKIYWTITVLGRKDSHIPGSIIEDNAVSNNYTYTEADKANGIYIWAEKNNESGEYLFGDGWLVYPDDENLTWTDTGWIYKMPETVPGKDTELGNDGWTYYLTYACTPNNVNGGSGIYQNRVTLDGKTADGWATFTPGNIEAGIIKNGSFLSDNSGGKFHWEAKATIPGIVQGEKAMYKWFINDHNYVLDSNGEVVAYVDNKITTATITGVNQSINGGKPFAIPHISSATENDPIAWNTSWYKEANGIYYTQQIILICRCRCTEATCHIWNSETGKCAKGYGYNSSDGSWHDTDYCYCWTIENPTEITFTYDTTDLRIIEKFGGSGHHLQNYIDLNYTQFNDAGTEEYVYIDSSDVRVPIPGYVKKEITKEFDGYVANYTITVNEAKIDLVKDGGPLNIKDTMTDTLAFIQGTLVITAEDTDGNVRTLTPNEDYTFTYDGSGEQTDKNGKPVHILDIDILEPGPEKYTLNYDATLVIPENVTEAVRYSNSATITVFGQDLTVDSAEKIYADINITAKNYYIDITKKDESTESLLAGAVFGLYNSAGGLIATETADEKGELTFKTSVTDGIILRDHEAYYIQEIKAPSGYMLDDTKHWFCFCEERDTNGNHVTAEQCTFYPNINDPDFQKEFIRVPRDRLEYDFTNTPSGFELPATGGSGTKMLMIGGTLLIIISALLLCRNFVRERRYKDPSAR